MKIPFVDLKANYLKHKEEIDAAIKNVVDNTAFINGADVKEFEKEFAQYCESKFCVGTNSGTSALQLALNAAGIGKGDEVITTPHTFIATGEVIVQVGATAKFVDIDEKTYNIDHTKIEAAITPHTKAIIVVHLYGHPCEMDAITQIAKKHNLVIIEDCAQVHGAYYKNQRIPVGDYGCFSFYPAKNLGCFGDGGAIVVNNEQIKDRLICLRNHGRMPSQKYEHELIGYNERIDTIQAAVLRVKLKYLDADNEQRRTHAARYNEAFKELAQSGQIVLPFEDASTTKNVYYVYTIRTQQRDALIAHLKEHGIPSQIYFPIPLHLQPAFKFMGLGEGSFPVCEKAAKEILSLPVYPELTSQQQDYIIAKVMEFFAQ